MINLTPKDLILARTDAFRRADFGFIYDSYHSDSNFRQQYDDREEYIRFGWASLGKDFRIEHCEIIRHDLERSEARVIYLMEITVQGELKRYAELAWLRLEVGAWRYHRGQKMDEEDLPEDPSQLTFDDFNNLEPKIVF
jgi:SEC-C motif-containing protein